MAAASDCRPLGTISADGLEQIHQRRIYWQHQSVKADFLNTQYPPIECKPVFPSKKTKQKTNKKHEFD